MRNRSVLISGAGIAGPALAYWLARDGFEPTVVERAPAPRPGGNAVDFRGPVHMRVLTEMGLLEKIRERQTHMQEITIVDESGRRLLALPPLFASGEVEIERGDLATLLWEETRSDAEYIFGDSVAALEETTDGVEVTFERGRPRRFDLVVGADGLHSNIRARAFGEESRFLRFQGYYVATFSIPNFLGLDHSSQLFSVPGRSASISSVRQPSEAKAVFVFASKRLEYGHRDSQRQKEILAELYAGVGWQVPRLLELLPEATDLYFDAISTVEIDVLSRGRVALLGDAGYGGTLGGQGNGLAIVGAYVLAGELASAGGHHVEAFARYQSRIWNYAKGCQKGAKGAGPFHAPRTRMGLALRNGFYRAMTTRPLSKAFEKLVTNWSTDLVLPEYRPAV